MAWTDIEGHPNSGFIIYSQTLTTKELGNGADGDNWTSEIDFIPPATDFRIIANTGATNLSTSTHLELFYSITEDAAIGARTRINETPFIPVTGELDTATTDQFRDISDKGEYPWYYLHIPKGGGSVVIKIIVNRRRA